MTRRSKTALEWPAEIKCKNSFFPGVQLVSALREKRRVKNLKPLF